MPDPATAAPSTCRLTVRQAEVLAAVRRLTAEHGYPPTVREVAAAVGLASASSAHAHMRTLEARGLLASRPGCSRTRRVVEHQDIRP